MKIVFDRKTSLRKMKPMIIIFPEIIEKAKEMITDIISRSIFDFFGMTIAEFLRLQEQILPDKVNRFLARRKTTFHDYIKIVNAFEHGAKSFEAIIEDTTIPAEPDEESARSGLLDITTEEAMLTSMKDFFGLTSLEKAQSLTLYEYVTARKVMYNNAKFQKNLIAIQKIKI